MSSLHAFRRGDSNNELDSETDDEMPPLEMTETNSTPCSSSSTTPAPDARTPTTPSSSGTPTRRIVRAVRPKNDGNTTLANVYGTTPPQAPPANTTTTNAAGAAAANTNTSRQRTTSAGGSNVPLAVNWNLFPAPSTGDTPPPSSSSQGMNRTNQNPSIATLRIRINTISNDDDDDNDEDDDDDSEEEGNPNHNPFAALQSDSTDEEEEEEEDDEDEDEDDDDEILSCHSSDFDSDEPDEDHDDEEEEHEMPRGMINFFRIMSQIANDDDDDDNDEDNDDDDDDDGPCTCRHCLLERFGCGSDDESEDLDNSETPLDPNSSPCAICMEPETAHRKFIDLPCCGHGIQSTSSTRFCYKCLVRYMAKNGCGVPKVHARNNAGMLAGECPRCKHLLVLMEEEDNDCCLPYHKRARVVKASTQSFHWYIGQKDGGNYRFYLLTLGWCSPHYIPEELLLNDPNSRERIAHLCQWGLIQRVKSKSLAATVLDKNTFLSGWATKVQDWLHEKFPSMIGDPDAAYASATTKLPNTTGFVYQMDPQTQIELRSLLLQHMEIDVEDDLQLRMTPSSTTSDEENGRKHSFMAACNCTASAWMSLCKFRFIRAIRIANRGMTLGLLSSKHLLPPVAEWTTKSHCSHEACWHAMTFLNLMLVLVAARLLQQVFWIGIYLGQAFLVCQFVGSCVVTPRSLWKRWTRNGLILYVTTYGFYRFWWWLSTKVDEEKALDAAVQEEL